MISIGDGAFGYCPSLTLITVDSNNQYYSSDKYGAFYNKDKTTLIRYPAGNSRTTFEIPDSVTSVCDWAFSYCDSLASIIIPDSVRNIGDAVFYDCTGLTSVTIGNSVTSIGYRAFYCCGNLTDVYYNGTEEEWNEISIGSENGLLLNATIHFISEECVHNFGLWEITTEPTETEDGVKTRVCSICGSEETDRVPKTGITVTVTDSDGNVIKEEVISGDMTEISFEDIADGEYTVTVSKETYATRTYTVTATDGEASLDFNLNKTGDMNGDGSVNAIDVALINAHSKGVKPLW